MRACPMDFLKKDILKLGLVAMGQRGVSQRVIAGLTLSPDLEILHIGR